MVLWKRYFYLRFRNDRFSSDFSKRIYSSVCLYALRANLTTKPSETFPKRFSSKFAQTSTYAHANDASFVWSGAGESVSSVLVFCVFASSPRNSLRARFHSTPGSASASKTFRNVALSVTSDRFRRYTATSSCVWLVRTRSLKTNVRTVRFSGCFFFHAVASKSAKTERRFYIDTFCRDLLNRDVWRST